MDRQTQQNHKFIIDKTYRIAAKARFREERSVYDSLCNVPESGVGPGTIHPGSRPGPVTIIDNGDVELPGDHRGQQVG